jgi:hypothetical protein
MLTRETLDALDPVALGEGVQPAPGQAPAGTANVTDTAKLSSPAPSATIPQALVFPVFIKDPLADRAGSSTSRPPNPVTIAPRPEPKVRPELRAVAGVQASRGFVALNWRGSAAERLQHAVALPGASAGAVVDTTLDETPTQAAAATTRTPLLVLAALLAGFAWVFSR